MSTDNKVDWQGNARLMLAVAGFLIIIAGIIGSWYQGAMRLDMVEERADKNAARIEETKLAAAEQIEDAKQLTRSEIAVLRNQVDQKLGENTKEISELRETMARVDERTAAILNEMRKRP